MDTMTTFRPGPDRARSVASSHAHESPMMGIWHDGSSARCFCGSTGLFTDTAVVNETADTVGARKRMIERPTRHLGTRST